MENIVPLIMILTVGAGFFGTLVLAPVLIRYTPAELVLMGVQIVAGLLWRVRMIRDHPSAFAGALVVLALVLETLANIVSVLQVPWLNLAAGLGSLAALVMAAMVYFLVPAEQPAG